MAIQANKSLEDIKKGDNLYDEYLELGKKDNESKKVKFQFLKDPIIAYELFAEVEKEDGTTGMKPMRARDEKDLESFSPAIYNSGDEAKIKQVMVAPVWDLETNKVKILKIDKSSVLTSIISVEIDDDMGEVNDYVWKISWEGEGLKRKYTTVTLGMKKEVPAEIQEAVSKVDMEAYLRSEKTEVIFGTKETETKKDSKEEDDFGAF